MGKELALHSNSTVIPVHTDFILRIKQTFQPWWNMKLCFFSATWDLVVILVYATSEGTLIRLKARLFYILSLLNLRPSFSPFFPPSPPISLIKQACAGNVGRFPACLLENKAFLIRKLCVLGWMSALKFCGNKLSSVMRICLESPLNIIEDTVIKSH